MAEEHATGKMGATDILKEAWDILTKKFNALWPLAALVGLPSVLQALFVKEIKVDPNKLPAADTSWGAVRDNIESITGLSLGTLVIGTIVLLVVYTLYQVFVQAAVLKNIIELLRRPDTNISWNSLMSAGKAYFLPLLSASIVVLAIVVVGALFFIIPGIIAAFLLAFTGYLVVDQHLSTSDAMKKSYHMAKAHAGDILVLALLLFAIAFASSIVVSTVVKPLPYRLEGVVNSIYSALFGLFGTIAFTRLYLQLKSRSTHPAEVDS